MMPTFLIVVSLVTFFAFAIAACAMFAIGIRGRGVACPPCCAGCGHATGDLVVAAGSRCAECGRALDGIDDIRYFRRSMRVRPFVYAGLLLALGFGIAFGITFLRLRFSSGAQVATQTPAQLAAAIRANGNDAWMEINALAKGATAMSDADLTAVVKAFRGARDAGVLHYVSAEAADLLGEARKRNLIDDEAVIEIANAGLEELRLDIPDDVRAGAQYQVTRSKQNVGIGGGVTAALASVTIDGAPVKLVDLYTNFATVQFDLPPGAYEITTVFDASATLTGSTGPFPAATASLTRKQGVRVHAADAPSWIERVETPELADDVRDAIRATVVTLDRQGDGRTGIRVDLSIRPTPSIPLSFDCNVEIAGVRHPLGARWSMMTENGSSYTSGTLAASADVHADDATTATLILTPSPSVIEQQRGVERIWGGEIRIPLRVVRDGQPTPPTPPPPPLPVPTDSNAPGGT